MPPVGQWGETMTDPSGASVNADLEMVLRDVAGWRVDVARHKSNLDTRRREFEQANANLILSFEASRTQLASAEMEARDLALAAYAKTGSKQPHPGVGIRVTTRALYDNAGALVWAKEHNLALKLDIKAFETLAKNGACGTLVVFTQEPTATIASDLSKVLDIEPVQR